MATEIDEIVARVKEEIFREVNSAPAAKEHPLDLAGAIGRLSAQSNRAWTLTGSWATKLA
ncbi:MAG TPA: hypothetical protein VF619_13175 [Allosphingosinicella sp.]|jgi:hypothetical protein